MAFYQQCLDLSSLSLSQINHKEINKMVSCAFNTSQKWPNCTCTGVLKSSEPADFKNDPGFVNHPRFVGV